ncbi:MAG: hypothetical protein CENE_03165 [Candidatus Celerinatantimonas neptuna]|nr:MAG: hypothetical protein CENE_03165 [Candidatus Celerinatantimonas neptuna]
MSKVQDNANDIAIVGMASHFPDAACLHEFWQNIIDKKDSITDVNNQSGDSYWFKKDFFHTNPQEPDKTYAHKAGFIKPICFDPVQFKMPPAIMDSISTAQLFALHVARQVMEDSGIVGPDSPLDKDRIGVILGGSGNGNTSFSLAARQHAPYLRRVMINSGLYEAVADDVIERVLGLYLEWNEDSFPGFLGNVTCGRIASCFDLGGTSYMVDAACASSLAAIKSAIGELHSGSCDAVLTGGVNLENSAFSFLCFSKTPALSKSNISRPFDKDSDGMMMGDGVGLLVLKRLEDAKRDKDKIYAVIKSVEASSDGRAKSIFAPRYEGQLKALTRAYERAGVKPSDIQLVEAHGTGTASGDQTELKALSAIYTADGVKPQSTALGSVKSQIGHTRCAAGAASMIKVAMALSQKVLPSTINVGQPNELLSDKNSPFYVSQKSHPWINSDHLKPRRAALSAFGFGGTNFHAVLEEYGHEPVGSYRLSEFPVVLVFHAADTDLLSAECRAALERFESCSALVAIREHLRSQDLGALKADDARLTMVITHPDQLLVMLNQGIKQLENNGQVGWEHPLGIYFQPRSMVRSDQIVAMFPGQGSQYVNMGRSVAVDFPPMRRALESLDQVTLEEQGNVLSPVIFPPPAFVDEDRLSQHEQLTNTANAQPAIGAISAGYYQILSELGFKAEFFCGHSYGEISALWAADVISLSDFFKISLARGLAADKASRSQGDCGAMLAVALSSDACQEILRHYPDVVIANDNATSQIVLGGSSDQIARIAQDLESRQIRCRKLPVSAAFHTHYVESACEPFRQQLESISFNQTFTGQLYSTARAERYSNQVQNIPSLLSAQLTQPVLFRQTIESIYQAGGRMFVEIGPKGVLGKLVGDILGDRLHHVVSVDINDKGDERLHLSRAIAKLVAVGVELSSTDLYARPAMVDRTKLSPVAVELDGGFMMSPKNKKRREHALRKGDTQIVDEFVRQKAASFTHFEASSKTELKLSDSANVINSPGLAVVKDKPIQPSVNINVCDNKARVNENLIDPVEQSHTGGREQSIHSSSHLTRPRGSFMETKASLPALQEDHQLSQLLSAQQVMSQLHQQFQTNQQDYISLLSTLLDKQFSLMDKFPENPNLPHMLQSLGHSVELLNRNLELYHANHERYFATQQALFSAEASQPHEQLNSPVTPRVASLVNAPQPAATVAQPAPVQVQASAQPKPAVTRSAPVAAAPVTPAKPSQAPQTPKMSVPPMPEHHVEVSPVATQPVAATVTPEPVTTPESSVQLDASTLAEIERLQTVQIDEIIKRLTAIVSDRTGYPEEMIEPEMDLEADLGIDSIKRLEIFGAMFDSFAADAEIYQATRGDDMETLDIDALSNVQKIASFFMDMLGEIIDELRSGSVDLSDESQSVQEDSPQTAPVVEHDAGSVAALHNFGFVTTTSEASSLVKMPAESRNKIAVIQHPDAVADALQRAPLGVGRYAVVSQSLATPDRFTGAFARPLNWLLIEEEDGDAKELGLLLASLGQKPVYLTFKEGFSGSISNRIQYQLTSTDPSSVDSMIDLIESEQGSIGGVVYWCAKRQCVSSLQDLFPAKDYQSVSGVYWLARRLQSSLSGPLQSYFFIVSRGDGQLGSGVSQPLPVMSYGLCGLVKSLNIEWESVFCRYLDIASVFSTGEMAAMVVQELQDTMRHEAEVGRLANGQRMTLKTVPVDETSTLNPGIPVKSDDVFIVTGGARGVTADCVLQLAHQVPATFILLGRSVIDIEYPQWSNGCEDERQLQQAAISYLKEQGERVTPVLVEILLRPIKRANEVRQRITQMQQSGATVAYYPCDITNADDVMKTVHAVEQQYGSVTGVIHGAGNLADKRIEKKTIDDFHNVFDVKVLGLANLCKALDISQLRYLMLFSSVSGFFGNAGQTDYALANEVLNKFSWMFDQYTPSSVIVRAINWGPWDGGMVNETLKRAYAEHNMTIIPIEEGCRRFVDEFKHITPPQVTIGGASYRAQGDVSLTQAEQIECDLQVSTLPFVSDHVIDGVGVLPLAAAINWLTRTTLARFAGYRLVGVHSAHVLKGIKCNEVTENLWHIELKPAAMELHDGLAIEARLSAGSPDEAYYQAILVISRQAPDIVTLDNLPDLNRRVATESSLYGDMTQGALLLHGPTFQGIQDIVSIDEHSLIVAAKIQCAQPSVLLNFSLNEFNFIHYDMALQLPFIWLMLNSPKLGLPMKIGSIKHYSSIQDGQEFYISMTVVANKLTSFIANIVMFNGSGQIYSQLEQVEYTVSKAIRNLLTQPQQKINKAI